MMYLNEIETRSSRNVNTTSAFRSREMSSGFAAFSIQ